MAVKIGELLVKKKLLTPDRLETALREQSQSGEFLGAILMRHGYVSEPDLLTVLAEQFQTKFVDLSRVYVNPQVIKLVPENLVREYNFLPIEMKRGLILIAVSNPLDMWPMSKLHEKLDFSEVKIVLAGKNDIQQAIAKYYGGGAKVPS